MGDTFSTYHPIINFLFFSQVLIFSMFFMHPVLQCISFFGALTYAFFLRGKKTLNFSLKYMLPILVATALINPAFNHEGMTILTYLPNGNPLTLESIVYGISAAVMLMTIMVWFSCYNVVMTSDKFIYLFGRIIPSLSLILSMVLRFVPRFLTQLQWITRGQRALGKDVSYGNIIQRIKQGIKILSIMVTWALENAIETADSMKSRGYGLPGRSAFSIYLFDRRDQYALVFLIVCGIYMTMGIVFKGTYWRYFPTIQGVQVEAHAISLYVTYFCLCIAPVGINIEEKLKWRAIRLKR